MGLGVPGIERKRTPEGCNAVLDAALGAARVAQVDQRSGIAGVQDEGAFVARDGFGLPALTRQHHAQGVYDARFPRVRGDSLLQDMLGAVEIARSKGGRAQQLERKEVRRVGPENRLTCCLERRNVRRLEGASGLFLQFLEASRALRAGTGRHGLSLLPLRRAP